MARKCPCGNSVSTKHSICLECAEIYGSTPEYWPEWLKWAVNDINRAEISDRRHDHVTLDEIEPNGRGGYRAKREFALRGCRNETHLYQEREQHGG